MPTKKDSAVSPLSAKPADLAAAQATPGTSTSTGGATATRNTGAATGGAVTITISGSSSTSTSTETSTETETTGSGKGGGKGAGKPAAGKGGGKATGSGGPDTGDKRPHVYNITVNSTGQSGNAVDSDKNGGQDTAAKKKSQTAHKGISGLAKPGKNAPAPKVSGSKI
jgi:hypothetical protein